MESEHLLRVYSMQHAQDLAILPRLSGDAAVEKLRRINQNLLDTMDFYFPWARSKDQIRTDEEEMLELRDLWVAEWGDPRDPDVQAKISATVAALQG